MTPGKTVEAQRLAGTEAVIKRFVTAAPPTGRTELRLQLLEAAASRFGGFDLVGFQTRFQREPIKNPGQLADDARAVVQSIEASSIHPALALSALAREAMAESDRRRKGVYHTDFRLAIHLARSLRRRLQPGMRVIDPACGAGILLAAVSAVICGSDRSLASEWLRNSIFAADLSPQSLRGTLIALSSFTDDLDALSAMAARWRVQDSLLAEDEVWAGMAAAGFDLVVANPPWEKVKLSRHEFSRAKGEARHYGSRYRDGSLIGYESARSERARQAARLVARYPTLASGEPDFYVAFTELAMKLTRPGGSGGIIVPAGLIRSLNTRHLREKLVALSDALEFTVMENRARYFAIDTRFKFLIVNYVRAESSASSCRQARLVHAGADADTVFASPGVKLSVSTLAGLRPDLTIPEVRSVAEWRLFRKMQEKGLANDRPDSIWCPSLCREIDMTRGRPHFQKNPARGCAPLIEGRMVQPHRLGCKRYVSGEGRSALWQHLPPGMSAIRPQFHVPVHALSVAVRQRMDRFRVGFCDITGQTNERSMMATLVPPGTVCGNKVPTVEFPNDPSEERLFLWLSTVNSLPFDWLLRRVVTTTVNYFVLRSLRLPPVATNSLPGRRLIEIAMRLAELDSRGRASFELCWEIARLRAEADVLVAKAYGCSEADLQLMLRDFLLLDRGQPGLPGEKRSTVTADLLMYEWSRRKSQVNNAAASRVQAAMHRGAVAYLSSEFVPCTTELHEVVNVQ